MYNPLPPFLCPCTPPPQDLLSLNYNTSCSSPNISSFPTHCLSIVSDLIDFCLFPFQDLNQRCISVAHNSPKPSWLNPDLTSRTTYVANKQLYNYLDHHESQSSVNTASWALIAGDLLLHSFPARIYRSANFASLRAGSHMPCLNQYPKHCTWSGPISAAIRQLVA